MDRATDCLKRELTFYGRLQFFDSAFDTTEPRPQFNELVVKKKSALSSFQLNPLKRHIALPTFLRGSSASRRPRPKWNDRFGFAGEVPGRHPEFLSQAERGLKFKALDVAIAHLSRGIGGDAKDEAELGVAQALNELFKALAKSCTGHDA